MSQYAIVSPGRTVTAIYFEYPRQPRQEAGVTVNIRQLNQVTIQSG